MKRISVLLVLLLSLSAIGYAGEGDPLLSVDDLIRRQEATRSFSGN